MNKYFSTAQSSHKILYSATTSIRLVSFKVYSIYSTNIPFSHISIICSRAHEEWGYCQAGTSAILLADKTALIGTPGPHTWRGTVFSVSTSDVSSFLFSKIYRSQVIFSMCKVTLDGWRSKSCLVMLFICPGLPVPRQDDVPLLCPGQGLPRGQVQLPGDGRDGGQLPAQLQELRRAAQLRRRSAPL